MNQRNIKLGVLLGLLTFLFSVVVFAQAAAPTPPATYVPPSWLTEVLTWIQGIPKVGPIIVLVLTFVSVLATFMTALSTFLLSVKASMQGIAQLAGASGFIDKVEALYQKIAPYVQYLSMYNVQKQIPPASGNPNPGSQS